MDNASTLSLIDLRHGRYQLIAPMYADVPERLLPNLQFRPSSIDGDSVPKRERDPCEVHGEAFADTFQPDGPKIQIKEASNHCSLGEKH